MPEVSQEIEAIKTETFIELVIGRILLDCECFQALMQTLAKVSGCV